LGKDPSPGPRRLEKAPVAVHPLPTGEGKALSSLPSPVGKGAGIESFSLSRGERVAEGRGGVRGYLIGPFEGPQS
jgi:hypothetical protein